MTKKSGQTFKYPKNERTLKVKQKAFFITLKGLPVGKNCIRPESGPLKGKGVELSGLLNESSYLIYRYTRL